MTNDDTPRALVNRLAVATVLALEFEKLSRRLPPVDGVDVEWVRETEKWDADHIPVLRAGVKRWRNSKGGPRIELADEDRVDAVREWAQAIGGSLALSKEYVHGTSVWRMLTAEGRLPSETRVRVITTIDYELAQSSDAGVDTTNSAVAV